MSSSNFIVAVPNSTNAELQQVVEETSTCFSEPPSTPRILVTIQNETDREIVTDSDDCEPRPVRNVSIWQPIPSTPSPGPSCPTPPDCQRFRQRQSSADRECRPIRVITNTGTPLFSWPEIGRAIPTPCCRGGRRKQPNSPRRTPRCQRARVRRLASKVILNYRALYKAGSS